MTVFVYNQNNSFGYFDQDDNVAEYVIIEAVDAEASRAKAEYIGMYFDGCEKGVDCPCCGDRWDNYPECYETFFAWVFDWADRCNIYITVRPFSVDLKNAERYSTMAKELALFSVKRFIYYDLDGNKVFGYVVSKDN